MKTLLFFLSLFVLLSQSNAQTFTVAHRFVPGENYTFENRKIEKGVDVIRDQRSITNYVYLSIENEDIEVIHASLTFGPIIKSGIDSANKYYSTESPHPFQNFKLKIVLDENGGLVALDNFEECIIQIQKLNEELSRLYSNMTDEMKANLATSYMNAETMLNTYFTEIYIYFDLYGTEWNDETYFKDEGIEYNAVFGLEIPYHSEIDARQLSVDQSEIVIKTVVDQNELKSILQQSDLGNVILKTPLPEMSSTQEYLINNSTHMVESWVLTKYVVTDGLQQSFIQTFKLLK